MDDVDKFLELPTDDEIKDCFRKFCTVTSNDGLREGICVVCARECRDEGMEKSRLLNDPSIRTLLVPSRHHPAHVLWHSALVLGNEVEELEDGYCAFICIECVTALQKAKLPRFALANDLWIGDTPYQLGTLTIPEQLLVARHYPRCYIFKLYPREGGQMPSESLQRGMKGNISLYELNTKDVVKMLDGQMMPNAVSTLASVLAITFVGSKVLPKDWLKSTFRVRRRSVYKVLLWLKANNCLYGYICIDED
jgi:hypothetical protein